MRGKRIALQISNAYLSEILFYWIEYGKPCQLNIAAAKTSPDLCGICFNNDTDATDDFLRKVVEKTNAQVHSIERK